ncbi:MAG: hypothetical protein HRT35_21790 [Algicola sp.]|nr:hypothetical protein [Algicola sp.]
MANLSSTKGPGDFSLREEVAEAINKGGELDVIVEGIVEDVEDIYHEQTVAAAQSADDEEKVENADTAQTVDTAKA